MVEDHQRFTEMYDACRQRVWAYVVSRAGRQVADEVVSEVFAIAWRRFADVPRVDMPRVDAPRADGHGPEAQHPALPWLIGVARNVLRDNIRAEARRESMRAELRAWTEGEQGDHAEAVAEKMATLRALAALPEEDRELLLLIAWQGLGPREAAKVVGCGQAAFRVRLHRARRRLAKALAAPNPLPAPVRIAS